MHPDRWLDSLFGSRARVRILRELCEDPGRVWTERELAHAVGMSPNTINLAIRQLRDAGVMDFRRIGRTHAVKLRDDLKLIPSLRRIFELESGAIAMLRGAIEQALPTGVACYLYGSTIRGDATQESDVDVLLIARDEAGAEDAGARVLEAAHEAIPSRVEVITYTARKFRQKRNSAFLRAVLKEGLPLGTTRLEDVLA
ncbi:MAG TPA: nucleotidyltransferase domain-containing protein [Candidatus Thermoplasmatota archaeon]|nr:nucleotidyltransferase domain-containing protein [Candidatus Thermoplasmatota archaeon]